MGKFTGLTGIVLILCIALLRSNKRLLPAVSVLKFLIRKVIFNLAAASAGALLRTRMVIDEFVAYMDLSKIKDIYIPKNYDHRQFGFIGRAGTIPPDSSGFKG